MTDEEVEEKIRQEFKMKGLILADVNIIKKMDKNIENEPKGISKIIPATIKKDGEISDRGTSAVTKEQFVYLQKYMEKIKEIFILPPSRSVVEPDQNKGKCCKHLQAVHQ